jgi:hypothetical protein
MMSPLVALDEFGQLAAIAGGRGQPDPARAGAVRAADPAAARTRSTPSTRRA